MSLDQHDHATAIASLVDAVSADRLMEYSSTLAQWTKLSGSPEERVAFDYIENTLRGWGLETERFSPQCLVSWPLSAALTDLATGTSFACITHSFSTSTEPDGVTAPLVYVGQGEAADYRAVSAPRFIALAEGPATPDNAVAAESSGAVGVVHISAGAYPKEMIISPVWGTPTPETIHRLPTLPHVSVNEATGETLKQMLDEGPVEIRLTSEVETSWKPLPILVTNIDAADDTDDFVLLSGHVDAWHYGALDNGTANASMLEIARVLTADRKDLRRNVRIAFWSGHSHARYATSAWYVDEFWTELQEHCVAHVNIDGPGARGATNLQEAPTMAEAFDLAAAVIEGESSQSLEYHRMSRMGDQSFWGAGIASAYVTVSSPGPDGSMEWHHTPLDTMDYVDPALLERDARVLLATVARFATDRLLPLNHRRVVDEITSELTDLSSSSSALDLTSVLEDANHLGSALDSFYGAIDRQLDDAQAELVNQAILAIGRCLVPVNYTRSGPFEQDLALPAPCLPGLQEMRDAPALPTNSQERLLMETKLRRERNRVRHALREAARIANDTATRLEVTRYSGS
jgi:Iap family predicted aminopeptidase